MRQQGLFGWFSSKFLKPLCSWDADDGFPLHPQPGKQVHSRSTGQFSPVGTRKPKRTSSRRNPLRTPSFLPNFAPPIARGK